MDFRNRYLIGSVIIVIATIGLYNIYKDLTNIENNFQPSYGRDYNMLREIKNIPLVEDDWIKAESSRDFIIWGNKNPMLKTFKPFHYYKELEFRNDSLIVERDVFHYETKSKIAFRLSCRYTYDLDTASFEFIKYFKESYPPTTSFHVTQSFADSVFSEWGLRSYY